MQQEIADPDRPGITRWNYGGFMTAWAITQTARFKTVMMGAGIAKVDSLLIRAITTKGND